ncbi:MAG: GNAT family N-acetyltransferase [Phycisphaerae bacterium]|nr:GNAT family N-acetyltransferase [Phycisphaerae bacterium]
MTRTTVSSLLRSTQAFAQQICDKETLDHGIAFYSERFAGLPEANQFREVYIDDPSNATKAWEQAESWFARQGLRCQRWSPGEGQAIEPLEALLSGRGFEARRFDAMILTQWAELSPSPPQVRVIHARAVRQAYRETFIQSGEGREAVADAYAERLDDPSFDAFVALAEGNPAARATLYQVGDIARVMDVCVLPAYRGLSLEDALLSQALGLARRLAMRTILAQVPVEDEALRTMLGRAGFAEDGSVVEFHRVAE